MGMDAIYIYFWMYHLPYKAKPNTPSRGRIKLTVSSQKKWNGGIDCSALQIKADRCCVSRPDCTGTKERNFIVFLCILSSARMSSCLEKSDPPLVFPCDQCLHRKVRCDKTLPRCSRCSDASLSCTRQVVRRRPGRRKGLGLVISRLRKDPVQANKNQEIHKTSQDISTPEPPTAGSQSAQGEFNLDELYFTVPRRVNQPIPTPYSSPTNSLTGSEGPAAVISNLPYLSEDIDQFFSNLYPIWPIIDESSFRKSLEHPEQLDYDQACLILSICALSTVHIPLPESESLAKEPRKSTAQRFIKQCMQLRSSFAYIETASILTIQTSLFLSVAEVELQRTRSSWILLNEAIMLAQELYEGGELPPGLSQAETLSIQRTLYLLSLTERGLIVLRNKRFGVILFDSSPEERFDHEDPRILVG